MLGSTIIIWFEQEGRSGRVYRLFLLEEQEMRVKTACVRKQLNDGNSNDFQEPIVPSVR